MIEVNLHYGVKTIQMVYGSYLTLPCKNKTVHGYYTCRFSINTGML